MVTKNHETNPQKGVESQLEVDFESNFKSRTPFL